MPGRHVMLALVLLLGSAALPSSALASAAAERPALGWLAQATRLAHTSSSWAPVIPDRAMPPAPKTPIPMNLPDDATEEEVAGGYAIGVAGLIIGAVLLIGLTLGAFYIVSRRSWSATH